jgi:hypothetical protein
MRLVHRAWKERLAKFEPVWMLLLYCRAKTGQNSVLLKLEYRAQYPKKLIAPYYISEAQNAIFALQFAI